MKKKIICYLFLICTVILLILASDESRRPLILTGDNLRRDTGSLDGTTLSIAEDSGYSGRLAYTWNYMLEKGSYTLGIEYRTDTADNPLYVYNNGSTALTHQLNPAYTYEELPLVLKKDSQEILIELHYSGSGSLSVSSIQLTPQGRFYQDAYFFIALFLLLHVIGFFIYRSRYFRALSRDAKMIAFGLLAVSLAASLPLLNSYLNWADDLCYHLIRIEGIKDGLLDGQLPVIIYPEGLYGNGYLNCMYPNLFLYIPAVIRIFGVSMASSYKFLVILFHLLTSWITYASVKSISHSRKAAFLATILYVLCPYRLTNVYARGALGEFLAMTFMPLLFAGLYHVLLGERKKWWMLVLGLSGLIQTHILSALLGVLFCVFFGILCLATVLREKRYVEIGKAAATTLLCNLWFVVPFVYYYTKGNLWSSALDWCTYSEYSLNLSGLLGTLHTTDYRVLSLGLPIAICAGAALFFFLFEQKKGRIDRFAIYLFVFGCICTFMVINQFPGWPLMELDAISFLFRNIQFAWRLLGPASILLIMSGCILLYRSDAAIPYRKGLFFLMAGISVLAATRYQADDFAYENYYDTFTVGHESKLRGIPKGDNTIVYPYEWRPYGTIEAELSTEPSVSDPSVAAIVSFERAGTTHSVTYTCTGIEQYLSLPAVFYAGYQAYDETGTVLPLVIDEENNTLRVLMNNDGNQHQIVVKYKGLFLFTMAFWLSLLSTIAVGYLVWRSHRNTRLR